jgi:threonine/homoserine/homoserine lactone efflux protein
LLNLLIISLTFGLSIGIAPSPLLTLAITQTISHNIKEGLKIVFTPLLTDIPLLILTVLLYSQITNIDFFLGVVSILGALFIGFLGYKNISAKGLNLANDNQKADSLKKGVLTNLLNPYPYIFWVTVGGPMLIDSFKKGLWWGLTFIFGFYFMLIASRVVLVCVLGKSMKFIKGNGYVIVLRVLGAAMMIFAIKFFNEGFQRLSIF